MSAVGADSLAAKILKETQVTGLAASYGKGREKAHRLISGSIVKGSSIPVSEKTLFDLQSITKVVAVAALVLELEEAGKLKLSEKVQDLLPEFQGREKEVVSVEHLLLHSSGLSDLSLEGDFASAEALWQHMFQTELAFSPGSSVEYTDLGYRLLGRYLERKFTASLDELSRTYVWSKAGISQITYDVSKTNKNMLAGHGESWGRVDDQQDHLLGGCVGCDGVFASLEALEKLAIYLLTRFHAQSPALSRRATSDAELNSYMSALVFGEKIYGWESNPRDYSYTGIPDALEKAGGAGAFFCIVPATQEYFIYLTNQGRPDPFTEEAWNKLVSDLAPREVFHALKN
jgi:CubicO group peptidase (beta-lactamase class C family)